MSDRATNHKKIWSELGVSGEKDTSKTNLTILRMTKDIFICSAIHPILFRMSGIDYNLTKRG